MDRLLPKLVQWLALSLLHIQVSVGKISFMNLSAKDIWLTKGGHFTLHVEEMRLNSRLFSREVYQLLVLTVQGVHITADLSQATSNLSTLHRLSRLSTLPALVMLVQSAALQVHNLVVEVMQAGWLLKINAAGVCLDGNTMHDWCLLLASVQTVGVAARLLHDVGSKRICVMEASLEALLQANIVARKPFHIELVSINVRHFKAAAAADELTMFLRESLNETGNEKLSGAQTKDFALAEKMVKFAPDLRGKSLLINEEAELSSVKKVGDELIITVTKFKMVAIFVPLPRSLQTNTRALGLVSSDVSLCEVRSTYKKECFLLLVNLRINSKLATDSLVLTSTAEKLHAIYNHGTLCHWLSNIFRNWCRPSTDVKSLVCRLDQVSVHLMSTQHIFSAGLLDHVRNSKWKLLIDNFCLHCGDTDHEDVVKNFPKHDSTQQQLSQPQGQEHLVVIINSICVEWSPCLARSLGLCLRVLLAENGCHDSQCFLGASTGGCRENPGLKFVTREARFLCWCYRRVLLLVLNTWCAQLAVMQTRCASFRHQRASGLTSLDLLESVYCHWSTSVHKSMLVVLHEISPISNVVTVSGDIEGSGLLKESLPSWLSKLQIHAKGDICLDISISPRHKIELSSGEVFISLNEPCHEIWAKTIGIAIDEMEFITVEDLTISKMISNEELIAERQSFETFLLDCNSSWSITADLIRVYIPHKHNFPEAIHEDLRNICKWLRHVHKKDDSFLSLESTLPADVIIKVKHFAWQLAEEPFEVRLLENYMLLKDEQEERCKRSKMLETKIMNMHAAGCALSVSQVEHLFYELGRKNAEMYIRRSKQMRTTHSARSAVFSCYISDLKLMLLADPSQHGSTNIISIMRKVDKKSPWPRVEPLFSLLWCRAVSVNCKDSQLQLRDIPRPLCSAAGLALWGTLVGAQLAAARTAERSVVVSLAPPWRNEVLTRNMHPLKLYHDLYCEVQHIDFSWGTALVPIIAQCTLAFEQLLPVSKDPSRPLRYWDKIRLLAHGQFTAVCHQLEVMLRPSLDPYNKSDGLQIRANTFAVDLSDGRVVCEGSLSAHVLTQSSYDECRLLQLHLVRLSMGLLWSSLGDPHDHLTISPYAPDQLPLCGQAQERDSFRAFRSQRLDLNVTVKLKPAGSDKSPMVLVYGRTIRWLQMLSEALATVSRPIRRGAVFHETRKHKVSLFRHLRNVQLVLETHALHIQYWTSFAKQDGFTIVAGPTLFSSEYNVALVPRLNGLKHRPALVWNVCHMTCNMCHISVTLSSISHEPQHRCPKQSARESGFMSVGTLRYRQEATLYRYSSSCAVESSRPKHRLVVHGLRGVWNKHNRDTLFVIIAAYTNAQQLQRNLSRDLLRNVQHSPSCQSSGSVLESPTSSLPNNPQLSQMRPEAVEQLPAMLARLVAEVGSKPVAHCENTCEWSHHSEQNMLGPAACQEDDITSTNCLLTLVKSQVMLKGCETGGFILASAAKAELVQRSHTPAWRHHSLVPKTTWTTCIEGMQYYASTAARDHLFHEEEWLAAGLVEQPICNEVDDLPVGTVVTHSSSLQLQRIVSPCQCTVVYLQYGQETVDPSTLKEVPPRSCEGVELAEEAVNCLTFTHRDLDIATSSRQYEMVVDAASNLVLHVDPGRRQACDRLQKMRFRWQLLSGEDQSRPVLELQEYLRSLYSKLRLLKKEYYKVQKSLAEDPDNELFMQEIDDLELKVGEYKKLVNMQSEELHMMLICCKEAQLSSQRKLTHEPVSTVRLNKIFLKHVRWQLTDASGELGLADFILWNLLYVNSIRSDNSGEHLVELEYMSLINLLPGEPYQKVLYPTQIHGSMPVDRKLSLRIICREKAPVAGISVIEHFEINVAPLTIGITKKFFYTVLKFFFPERELHRSEEACTSKKSKSLQGKFYVDIDSSVEKMKVRAQHNKLFVYTKLTSAPVRLSYHGGTKMEEVRDLRLVLPTLQYHNMTWTWLDLLLALRSDCRRLIFSQTLKHKLRMKRDCNSTDILETEHEDEVMHLLHGRKNDA